MIWRAIFSADGRYLVTVSTDLTARVWRTDGQGEPVVLRGHEGELSSAAFSPGGALVLTGSHDHTARIWRADGAGEPIVLRGHEGAIRGVGFSHDGARVVTASDDRTARIWQADGSRDPVVLRGHQDRILLATFSPDDRHVVTVSDDRSARLWRADGRGEARVLRTGMTRGEGADTRRRFVHWTAAGDPVIPDVPDPGPRLVRFSPDGATIASASHLMRVPDTGEVFHLAKLWPVIEPLRGIDDPRLWTATSCCPSVEERMNLLGNSVAKARHDLRACERRVREDGPTVSPAPRSPRR